MKRAERIYWYGTGQVMALALTWLLVGCQGPGDAGESKQDAGTDAGFEPAPDGSGEGAPGDAGGDALADGDAPEGDATADAVAAPDAFEPPLDDPCVPANCGPGPLGERPPWGCPEVCDWRCEGDRVCCEDGSCQQRAGHHCDVCDEGCDMELTVSNGIFSSFPGIQCWPFGLHGRVCNRGTTVTASAGQVVRFETEEGMHLCDVATADPVAPGTCVGISCDMEVDRATRVRATLNPDEPDPECGNPIGVTDSAQVMICD
jgi:hypothetical protein